MNPVRLGTKRSKYNVAEKAARQLDGYTFDSKAEMQRYAQLRLLERANDIQNLQVHPSWVVKWPGTDVTICLVELDFSYTDVGQGRFRVEDVKGVDTALSKVKRKLVEQAFRLKVEMIK